MISTGVAVSRLSLWGATRVYCGRARHGWTLIEILVALVLAAIITALLSQTFGAMMKQTTWDTRRAGLQSQTMSIWNHLEKGLQRCVIAGISWSPQPAGVGVLAMHQQDAAALSSGIPMWNPYYTCLLYDKPHSQLLMCNCPTAADVNRPDTKKPSQPAAAELNLMRTAQPGHCRILGQGVSDFSLQVQPGPIAHLTLELQVEVPGQTKPESLRIERDFYFRMSH